MGTVLSRYVLLYNNGKNHRYVDTIGLHNSYSKYIVQYEIGTVSNIWENGIFYIKVGQAFQAYGNCQLLHICYVVWIKYGQKQG